MRQCKPNSSCDTRCLRVCRFQLGTQRRKNRCRTLQRRHCSRMPGFLYIQTFDRTRGDMHDRRGWCRDSFQKDTRKHMFARGARRHMRPRTCLAQHPSIPRHTRGRTMCRNQSSRQEKYVSTQASVSRRKFAQSKQSSAKIPAHPLAQRGWHGTHTSNTREVIGEQLSTQLSFSRAKEQRMHSIALGPVQP
jgi:hypothetical protein